MEIAAKIIHGRQMKLLSQSGLAYRLGVPLEQVEAWEDGRLYPKMGDLLKLSRLFDLSLDSLLHDDLPAMSKALVEAGEVKWMQRLTLLMIVGLLAIGPLLQMDLHWGAGIGMILFSLGLYACYRLFKIQYHPQLRIYSQILSFMAE